MTPTMIRHVVNPDKGEIAVVITVTSAYGFEAVFQVYKGTALQRASPWSSEAGAIEEFNTYLTATGLQ